MGVQEEISGQDVVVFSRTGCPYCRRAIEALNAHSIAHKVVELDAASKASLVKITGQSSVPQVFVKQQFVGGCNDGGMGGTLPLLANGTIQKILAGK